MIQRHEEAFLYRIGQNWCNPKFILKCNIQNRLQQIFPSLKMVTLIYFLLNKINHTSLGCLVQQLQCIEGSKCEKKIQQPIRVWVIEGNKRRLRLIHEAIRRSRLSLIYQKMNQCYYFNNLKYVVINLMYQKSNFTFELCHFYPNLQFIR